MPCPTPFFDSFLPFFDSFLPVLNLGKHRSRSDITAPLLRGTLILAHWSKRSSTAGMPHSFVPSIRSPSPWSLTCTRGRPAPCNPKCAFCSTSKVRQTTALHVGLWGPANPVPVDTWPDQHRSPRLILCGPGTGFPPGTADTSWPLVSVPPLLIGPVRSPVLPALSKSRNQRPGCHPGTPNTWTRRFPGVLIPSVSRT